MKRVLIIYEMIPESTNLYLEEVSDKDLKWLAQTHGYYLNCNMPAKNEKACNKLSTWLEKKTKLLLTVEKPLAFGEHCIEIDFVIHTGFML